MGIGSSFKIWRMNTEEAKEPSSRKRGQTRSAPPGKSRQSKKPTLSEQPKRRAQSGKQGIPTQSQQPERPTSSTTTATTTKQPAILTQSGQLGIPKQSTEQFSKIETSVEFGTSKTQKNVRQVRESSSGKQKGLGRSLGDHEYMSHTKAAYSKEELEFDHKTSSMVMLNREEEDKSTPDESFKHFGNVILVQSADDEGTTGNSHGAGGGKENGSGNVSHERGNSEVAEEAKNTCSDTTSSEQDDTSDTESLTEQNAFSENMTSTERGNVEIEDENSSCSSYDNDPSIVEDKIIDGEGESDEDNVLGASGADGRAFRGTATGEGLDVADVDDADNSRSHGGDGDASCAQGDDHGYADKFGVSFVRGDYSGSGSDDESVSTDGSHGVTSRVGSVDGSGDVEHCDSFSARDGGNDDVKFEIADHVSSGGDSNGFCVLGRAGSGGARVVSTATSGDGCGDVRGGDDDNEDDGNDDNQCSCPGEDENDKSDDNEDNGYNNNDDQKYDGDDDDDDDDDGDDGDDDDDDDNNDGTLVAEDNQLNRDNDLRVQPDKVELPKSRQVPYIVNVDVMEYIKSKHVDTFHSFLKDKGIKFIREPGAKLAHLECQGDESESVTALSSFLGDFETRDVPVDEVYWNCVVDAMSSICSGLGDIPPLVKPIESEKKLRIVSFKSDIDRHTKRLQVQLKKVKKEAAFVCETVSAPRNCDPKVLIFLLKKINFEAKRIAPECKNVKVIYDDDNEKIQFKGPKSQVKTAMEIFDEQIAGTTKHRLKLPQTILEFLSTEEGKEAIERTINHREIDAVVLFDDPLLSKLFSATLFGLFNRKDIDCIRNIAAEEKIKVEESNLRLKTTPDWKKLCKEIEAENGVFIRESESGSVLITGLAEEVRKGAGRMQEFLHKNSIERENYDCPTSDLVEYIIKYCKEDLVSIETSLEEFDFHIPEYEGQTLYMSGRRKGLQQARMKLDELINSLVVCSIDGRGPGLQKYLEKGGKGEQWVEKVQHYHECLIQIESTFDQKQDSCYFVTAHGHTISWVIGDIASQQVHTVVSPQGECTDAILRSCQEVRRFLGSLQAGEIVESPVSNLPCRHVLLTCCSNWNKGNGEQCLRIIVESSLRKVDEFQGKSIAFPAIGTGKLQFPPTEAARIMLDETIKFCEENPNSNVKDVRFVLLHGNDLVIDAFEREINHQQKTPRQSPVPQTGGKTWYENVHIFQGDLTKESQTEAILNVIASDKNMTKAGSLSATVVQAAGSGIEKEFRRLTRQNKHPSALMTSGGKLKVPHIIHIIPSSSDKHTIRKYLEKGLRLAKGNGIRSISLPAVGTGWYGLSASDSASLILKSLSNVWGSCTSFPYVNIVLLQSEFMSAFQQEKQKYMSPKIIQKETWCEKVEIVQGDLTKESHTDAIVNVIASDMNTKRDGSLSAVVVRAAGSVVENEFRSHLFQSKQQGAVVTSGGKLIVPHIIHIIPSSSDKQEIKKSLEEGLRQAKQRNMRSISLPAVGTGWYRLSASDSASVIFKALSDVWGSCFFSSKVRIVILQPDLMPAFEKEKQKYLALLNIQGGSRRNTKKGKVKIEIVNGDLIDENSDAIVNIINSDMNMDNAGELSRAIAHACGSGVKKECKQLGPQKGGSVVITSGGDLKVRHIIHLIPESSDEKHLQMCLKKCLQLADSEGLHSVSLPAIGTGGYRMPPAVAAKMIFQALASFSRSCVKIQSIRIVIKQMRMVDAFREEQKRQEESSSATVSTKPTNQSVRVTVTGKNQESVDEAISELNKDFSDSCLSEEINNDDVCYLFKDQTDMLISEAEKCDVEMTVKAASGCITLNGNKDEVHSMTKRINEAISEARERKIEQQEAENAQMISNTIEWCYALQRDNIPFDDAANLEIERAYTKGVQDVKVSSSGQEFVIYVKEKTGYLQNQQIAVTRKLKGAEGIALPEHWYQMSSDGKDFIQVPLIVDSTEYYEVSQAFYKTAKEAFITSIARIQNPFLYKTYTVSKATMDKKNGFNSERRLFHGTAAKNISSINTNGFNRSLCGTHGTYYGEGVYFARDAKKSQSYTESSMGKRFMYYVRVLVGEVCKGEKTMKTPPPINTANKAILYDSTVDKIEHPEEFVIYHDTHCYPEYLITFE